MQYHGKSQVSLSPCCSPSFAFLGVSAIPSLQRWATVHLTPAKPGCKEKLPYIYIYYMCDICICVCTFYVLYIFSRCIIMFPPTQKFLKQRSFRGGSSDCQLLGRGLATRRSMKSLGFTWIYWVHPIPSLRQISSSCSTL